MAKELFRVRVGAGRERLAFGLPERLFEGDYMRVSPVHNWDVTPAGGFLVVKRPYEADRRARYENLLSDRIYIDLGGLPALLSEARKGR